MQNNENYLRDKKQAAKFLGVSLGSLERLTRSGLPFIKVGGLVRFKPEDLTGYIETRRHVRTAEGNNGHGVAA